MSQRIEYDRPTHDTADNTVHRHKTVGGGEVERQYQSATGAEEVSGEEGLAFTLRVQQPSP